jgi:hypothetical protein
VVRDDERGGQATVLRRVLALRWGNVTSVREHGEISDSR